MKTIEHITDIPADDDQAGQYLILRRHIHRPEFEIVSVCYNRRDVAETVTMAGAISDDDLIALDGCADAETAAALGFDITDLTARAGEGEDAAEKALDDLRAAPEHIQSRLHHLLDFTGRGDYTVQVRELPDGLGLLDLTPCRWTPDYAAQNFKLRAVAEDGSEGHILHTLHWSESEDDDGERVWGIDNLGNDHGDPRAAISEHIHFDHHGILAASLDDADIAALLREEVLERCHLTPPAGALAGFIAAQFAASSGDTDPAVVDWLTHRVAVLRDGLLSAAEIEHLHGTAEFRLLEVATVTAAATAMVEHWNGANSKHRPTDSMFARSAAKLWYFYTLWCIKATEIRDAAAG